VNAFSPGVPIVYVAWVGNFPDALAAAAAAGKQGAPILFTNTGNTPDITQAALEYLAPEKIFVVGGTGVINQSNFSLLSGYAPQTFRLAGADRFATAVAVSKATYGPGVDVAYIAYGYNFPDALAGAAAAGFRGGPVLLTNSTTLHPATAAELTRLKPKRIVVLGGTGVISATVFNQLAAYPTGP
jgi:putative cell wall-binding protein